MCSAVVVRRHSSGPMHTGHDARRKGEKWSQVPFYCLLHHALLVACSVNSPVATIGFAHPNLLRFSRRVVWCAWGLSGLHARLAGVCWMVVEGRVNHDWGVLCSSFSTGSYSPFDQGERPQCLCFLCWRLVLQTTHTAKGGHIVSPLAFQFSNAFLAPIHLCSSLLVGVTQGRSCTKTFL